MHGEYSLKQQYGPNPEIAWVVGVFVDEKQVVQGEGYDFVNWKVIGQL
jgi:hypothetical protein